MLFTAMRPAILTGIAEVATASDVLDHAIPLILPRLTEEQRMPEEVFWLRFAAEWPRLLGAALDAVAAGLRNLPHTPSECLPRMASFARFVTAAEPASGCPGALLAAYRKNRGDAHGIALEACPIADPVRVLVAEMGDWKGKASELLLLLAQRAGEAATQRKKWPVDAARLSAILREAAPDLRAVGIEVDFHQSGGRWIRLRAAS